MRVKVEKRQFLGEITTQGYSAGQAEVCALGVLSTCVHNIMFQYHFIIAANCSLVFV